MKEKSFKHFYLILIVSFLVSYLVTGCTKKEKDQSNEGKENIHYQLQPLLSIQQKKDSIYFVLSLENKSNHPVTLSYKDSNMFDITVKDSSDNVLYQYTKGKEFEQKEQKVVIDNGESHIWTTEWHQSKANEKTGVFQVEAILKPTSISPGSLKSEELKTKETFTLQSTEFKLENNSFRNIQISGSDGKYKVSGEARVFEGVFGYTVSDGHNNFSEQHVKVKEGAPAWSPFLLNIMIPKDDLPLNGTLILELYYNSPKDGEKTDLLSVPLESFK